MTMVDFSEQLQLIGKKIDVSDSMILFNRKVTAQNLRSNFEIYNSDWTVDNGWLTGKNPDESAGMAVLIEDFPGNIMLEFEARTVLPSTHDINFMWNTEWSSYLNSCGHGYIGSICGWWTKRAGIEKSPDFKFRATTSGFNFIPGKTFKVQAGSIDGNCFIFIDGKLYIEANDPDPIDNQKYTKVALSVYRSWAQFKNIIIRQISWKPLESVYKPEF